MRHQNPRNKTDYSKKYQGNPFFTHRKKTGSPSHWSYYTVPIFVMLVAGAGIWLFFYSDYLAITDIAIKGDLAAAENEIRSELNQLQEEKILFIPRNKNIMTIDCQELEKRLRNKFFFSEFKIKKKYFHSLQIVYKLNDYSLIWKEDGAWHYIDDNARIIESVADFNQASNTYPIIENLSNQKISSRELTNWKEHIKFISQFNALISKHPESGILISQYNVADTIKTVSARIVGGPEVRFSISQSPEKQFQKLVSIYSQKDKNQLAGKSYIELRFGDMVYIK